MLFIRKAKIISSNIKSTVSKNNVFFVLTTVFYPRIKCNDAFFYRIYYRENGKRAGVEGAYEEHIELRARHFMVGDSVHKKRDSCKCREIFIALPIFILA